MYGKPLQLSCFASGFPVPKVILSRGNSILAIGSEGSVSWATHSVSTEDEGTYKCLAWNYEKIDDERTFRVFVKGTQCVAADRVLTLQSQPKVSGHPQKKALPRFPSFTVAPMMSTFLSIIFRTCKTTLGKGYGGKRKPLTNVIV